MLHLTVLGVVRSRCRTSPLGRERGGSRRKCEGERAVPRIESFLHPIAVELSLQGFILQQTPAAAEHGSKRWTGCGTV